MTGNARTVVAGAVTEQQLLADVVREAGRFNWLRFHQLRSEGTAPGWPDLTLIRPPELVFVELKTATGRVSGPQRSVLAALRGCGLEAGVLRPSGLAVFYARLACKLPMGPTIRSGFVPEWSEL